MALPFVVTLSLDVVLVAEAVGKEAQKLASASKRPATGLDFPALAALGARTLAGFRSHVVLTVFWNRISEMPDPEGELRGRCQPSGRPSTATLQPLKTVRLSLVFRRRQVAVFKAFALYFGGGNLCQGICMGHGHP